MAKDGVPPDCPLTNGEYQVLRLIATEGLTYSEIAARRHVTVATVRTHAYNAFKRLDVTGQAQAVATLYRNGWATWEPPPPEPQQPLPPWLAVYLHCLDAWLASGMRNTQAREGMRIAILGAQRTQEPDPRRHRRAPEPAHADDLAHIDGPDGYGHAHTGTT